MKTLKGKVYTLTNRLNGKQYVGATTISIPRRIGCHRQAAERGTTALIAQAIAKYGWQNFDVDVIATASTLEDLLSLEALAIAQLKTLTPHGYNRSSYGSNAWHFTPEERQRISLATMGRKGWNRGKSMGPLSDETKAKLSAALRGHKPWNKGIPATAETRLRLREAHAAMERHYNERSIEYQGVVYPSIVAARRATGLSKMQMKYRLRLGRARYVTAKGKG